MADTNDLRRMLKTASIIARRQLTEQQIDEAVDQITQHAKVSKQDLKRIGESVAHDPEVFSATDIDDINTVLDSIQRKK